MSRRKGSKNWTTPQIIVLQDRISEGRKAGLKQIEIARLAKKDRIFEKRTEQAIANMIARLERTKVDADRGYKKRPEETQLAVNSIQAEALKSPKEPSAEELIKSYYYHKAKLCEITKQLQDRYGHPDVTFMGGGAGNGHSKA